MKIEGLAWSAVRVTLGQGKHPTAAALALAIRGTLPIPDDLREYVAARIEGSIRPPRTPRGKNGGRELEITLDVYRHRDGKRGELQRAIASVAKERDVTEDAVKQAMRLRNVYAHYPSTRGVWRKRLKDIANAEKGVS